MTSAATAAIGEVREIEMDSVKRAASRLRRLQRALAPQVDSTAFLRAPFSVRPLATASPSVRRIIDGHVVAFVPPGPPLTDARLTCAPILVEFRLNGTWILHARLEAHGTAPVFFVVGFATNGLGYFGGLLGGLNFAGGPTSVASPSRAGTFSIRGFSQWVWENYDTAVREGVTFRVVSSLDPELSPVALANQWRAAFDIVLDRPLSLLDTDPDPRVARGTPNLVGGSLLDESPADPGLSFEVSLRFE